MLNIITHCELRVMSTKKQLKRAKQVNITRNP